MSRLISAKEDGRSPRQRPRRRIHYLKHKIIMLSTATSYLPSIAAAHLRSPAVFPALSVAASKVASTLAEHPRGQQRPRDQWQKHVCPHADLTHLEDPYHQYAYYPKLVSDLTSVSRLLDRHRAQEVVTPLSNISMDSCPSPKFNIV